MAWKLGWRLTGWLVGGLGGWLAGLLVGVLIGLWQDFYCCLFLQLKIYVLLGGLFFADVVAVNTAEFFSSFFFCLLFVADIGCLLTDFDCGSGGGDCPGIR